MTSDDYTSEISSMSDADRERIKEIDLQLESMQKSLDHLHEFMFRTEMESKLLYATMRREKLITVAAIARSRAIEAETAMRIAQDDFENQISNLTASNLKRKRQSQVVEDCKRQKLCETQDSTDAKKSNSKHSKSSKSSKDVNTDKSKHSKAVSDSEQATKKLDSKHSKTSKSTKDVNTDKSKHSKPVSDSEQKSKTDHKKVTGSKQNKSKSTKTNDTESNNTESNNTESNNTQNNNTKSNKSDTKSNNSKSNKSDTKTKKTKSNKSNTKNKNAQETKDKQSSASNSKTKSSITNEKLKRNISEELEKQLEVIILDDDDIAQDTTNRLFQDIMKTKTKTTDADVRSIATLETVKIYDNMNDEKLSQVY